MKDIKIDDMAELIKEKEKELFELKKEYRERRTEGLRHAIEQKKEAKGIFTVVDRRKHLCIKRQHPGLDIRFIFTNSRTKLRKGAKSNYGQWCVKHNFKYYDRIIPEDWLKEKGKIVYPAFISFKNKKIRRK